MGQAVFAGAEQPDGGTGAGSPVAAANNVDALAMEDGPHDASALFGAASLLRDWQLHPEAPTDLVRNSPGVDRYGRVYGYRIRHFASLPVLLERSGALGCGMVCLARPDDRYVSGVVLYGIQARDRS